jgi:dTDP-4-dehydrorhamnose 3,5-epimerase
VEDPEVIRERWREAQSTPPSESAGLPDGVTVFRLRRFEDARGDFAEVFRRSWDTGADPVQWSLVSSRAGTLRGVHLHPVHVDYLTILSGEATVGLCDLRPDSRTHGLSCTVALDGDRPSSIVIPNGIAHGFLFRRDAMSLYAVSHYWDPDDEVEMRWDDPLLAIPWDGEPAIVSERDLAAPPVAATLERLGWPQPAR